MMDRIVSLTLPKLYEMIDKLVGFSGCKSKPLSIIRACASRPGMVMEQQCGGNTSAEGTTMRREQQHPGEQ
jgi:hypothetical protein